MNTRTPRTPVESLRKGLEVLDRLVRAGEGGARPSELAEATGLKLTTAHNLLKTLELSGWASKEGRGRYVAGWRVGSLLRPGRLDLGPEGEAMRRVRDAARRTGEAVVLATLVGGRRTVLARAEGAGAVRVDPDAGGSDGAGLWSVVTGRVLAAFCEEAELRRILEREGMPGAAWDGLRTRERLGEALDHVRRQGFAEARGRDVASLAAPVLGEAGDLRGALGVYLPAYRYTEPHRREILSVLQQQASRLAALDGGGGAAHPGKAHP